MVDGQQPKTSKMKKKLIIYLMHIKIRKFDFDRFDADKINSSNTLDFEFHELADLTYPGFTKMFTRNRLKNKKIKIFSNFLKWKKLILKKKEIYKNNILIYNGIEITNFQSFKINYFLYKNKIKTLIASGSDHPTYSSNNLKNKFKLFFKHLLFNKKKIFVYFNTLFFSRLANYLKIKPTFFLKCGSISNSYEKNPKIKVLNGHSKDYNLYIKYRKKIFNKKFHYGLFLESASPVHNLGDSYIFGEKNDCGTAEKWLNSLNKFFSKLEDHFKIKILIVPHPKIKHKQKFSKLYNNREITNNSLAVLTRNAKLVISRDSTGFSYAAIYRKPAIFVFNEELKQENKQLIINQNNFANELGTIPINMDKKFSNEILQKLVKYKKIKYHNYINKYLTSRKDFKPNYKIIEEVFSM
jgi:hypothetical protein